MRGSTTDKRTPGEGNIINLVNVKEMAELAGHWSFLSSRRSRQDMSHGVPECGMPATVAAERHDLQTKAKNNCLWELKALQDAEEDISREA